MYALVGAMPSRRTRTAAVVATTACVGLLAYFYYENPARGEEGLGPSEKDDSETKLSSTRRKLASSLHSAGFFTSFGFVAASAVVFELAGGHGISKDWKWRALIGYVAGNHLLYAAHCVAGTGEPIENCPDTITDETGVGAMLSLSNRQIVKQLFDEHRLVDVLVHAGAVAAAGLSTKRVDSLLSLSEHLRRYAEIRPVSKIAKTKKIKSKWFHEALAFWTATAERKLFSHTRRTKQVDTSHSRQHKQALSVADVVDVFAHTRTACKVLTPGEIVLSLVVAETIRWTLRLDLIKHHRHGWADARKHLRERELVNGGFKGMDEDSK